MSNVFPRRNLPDAAEDWGRDVEGHIVELEKALGVTYRAGNNSDRAFTGQLSVLGRQIDELASRRIVNIPVGNWSVTGNATVEPFPRGSTTVTIPGSGGERSALVAVSFDLTESVVAQSNMFVEVYADDAVVARVQPAIGRGISGWPDGSLNAAFPVVVPESGLGLRMTLIRVGFSANTSTWTASNAVVTVYYGDRMV